MALRPMRLPTFWTEMPALVRLYIVNVAIGFGLACVFTGLLIGFNIANLRHLVMSANGGWIAVVMMLTFNTVVFAGVQFAIAVMSMAEPDNPPRGGLRQHVGRALRAVPVPARAANRRR